MITNPISKITAAVILIISLLALIGVFGQVEEGGRDAVLLLIGVSSTFLFVAQTKTAPQVG